MTYRNRLLPVLAALVLGSVFSSCRMRAAQDSLNSRFDMIDALISQSQVNDALSELKKIEKKAYDPWASLGVYKRYAQLGEDFLAERTLVSALKKHSDNPELAAVYTSFLLKHGRFEEASQNGKRLQGTQYGSLYSEAVLRSAAELATFRPSDFRSDLKFYQVYYDAYRASKKPVWLRNCAVFNLALGQYSNAAKLMPDAFADADDAFFWALVLYDAGRFYEAVQLLRLSQKYLDDYKAQARVTKIRQVALLSDAYMILSDVDAAEQSRQQIVTKLESVVPAGVYDEELLPLIAMNSAVWADSQEDYEATAGLLFYIVNRWPYFAPGIIHYADFAYRSSLAPDEDVETQALRRAGLSTLEMTKFDSRTKFPLSDAEFRLERALEETNDPNLHIAKLDLKYKQNKNLSVKEKTSDLWQLLEKTYSEEEKYKSLLTQYALSYLVRTGQTEDALSLFKKYVREVYNFDGKTDFWDEFAEKISLTELPFAEFGAYFAAGERLFAPAVRFYEYCVYESSGLLDEDVLSPEVSTEACLNLADIYYASGQKEKALDLYGKAAGRESSSRIRSEIFYKIACIYYADGDYKNALRSADYAVSIYPENARAALLKEKTR